MSQIINVEYNDKEIKNIILLNLTKLFANRGLIKKEKIESVHNKLVSSIDDNLTFLLETENKKKIGIILVWSKITSVAKNNILKDFLSQDETIKKFVVIKKTESTKKLFTDIYNNYSNVDIFMDYEMMTTIVEHNIVPQHILLSDEERNKLLEVNKDNGIKIYDKKLLKEIKTSDIIARYYGMKEGDICKIIRPSMSSGYIVDYKKITLGNIDQIFF
jgi:DNA-directed RNA polymerase I, II, and III subunit RPABC1